MSFAFDPRLAPGRNVRDVAAERLTMALGSLRELPSDAETSVHETRKRLKETRALLRLAPASLPAQPRGAVARTLRNAARVLAAGRDAHVQLRTLRQLADHSGTPAPEALVTTLVEQADRATQALLADHRLDDEVWQPLMETRLSVDRWEVAGTDFATAFAPGLGRTYREGRRQLARALADPVAEELHTLRTAVKRLWYHVRLLESAAPEFLAPLVSELDELGELLGDDHDLAVLGLTLDDLGPAGSGLPAALELRRLELQGAALPRVRRLLAEPTRGFVGRMTAWWDLASER